MKTIIVESEWAEFIEVCKRIGFGSVEITLQHGKPCIAKEEVETKFEGKFVKTTKFPTKT